MDTSETYIKMCEKAKEIQESNKRPIESSGLVIVSDGDVVRYSLADFAYHNGDFIWLPRQDQLQGMIDIPDWRFELVNCASFLADNFGSFATMEQLWLAFVMKEKYNKVWNGEDWVNITN